MPRQASMRRSRPGPFGSGSAPANGFAAGSGCGFRLRNTFALRSISASVRRMLMFSAVRCLTRSTGASLTEYDRIGSRASDRSIELMATISTKELRGGGAGTIIMVATGRKDGNDNSSIPSINSSSVITSYEPAGNIRSKLVIRNGCSNSTVSRRDRVIVMIILARWRGRAGTADSSWHIEAISRMLNAQ
ncbi:hypothetical protein ACVWW4_005895 [Bradyrhizobium sp. LB7.1]